VPGVPAPREQPRPALKPGPVGYEGNSAHALSVTALDGSGLISARAFDRRHPSARRRARRLDHDP
jgi:hypothetical protein